MNTKPLKYGVSLYSYTGDINTVLTLEDAFREIADLGATGIEILGEGNIAGYPRPSSAWVDEWKRLLETYKLEATNYGSWIDSRMWRNRDLTVDEGTNILARDLRLAHELGFTSVRPKIGVVTMDLKPHPIWDQVVSRNLDLAHDLNIVIAPEIHAPTPIKHYVVDEYIEFIQRSGSDNFRLLIDTGIFQRTITTVAHAGLSDEATEEGWRRPLSVPMSDLIEVIPYVHFIQTKFFDIDDHLVDQQIPWEEIIETLVDHEWSGYLSSEYEGDRSIYRSVSQVRRQHALLHRIEDGIRAER